MKNKLFVSGARYRSLEEKYYSVIIHLIEELRHDLAQPKPNVRRTSDKIEFLQRHLDGLGQTGVEAIDYIRQNPSVMSWAIAVRLIAGYEGLGRKKLENE